MAGEPGPSSFSALLIDFGGVLTTDVFASFEAFCVGAGGRGDEILAAFRSSDEARSLLVERETGRMSEPAYEEAFSALLRAGGLDVPADGLLTGMTAALRRDDAMWDCVAAIRGSGVPCVLVSNALDDASYDGYDLESRFDAVVLSHAADVACRKPSRRIYEIAASRAGVPVDRCVMVDDLQQNLDGAARLGVRGVLHRRADETVPVLHELFGLTPAG